MGFGRGLAPCLTYPYLIVVVSFVVKGCLIPFLWGWSKILLPDFWWSTTIRVNAIDMLQIVVVCLALVVSFQS
jgi:hypothetical protein